MVIKKKVVSAQRNVCLINSKLRSKDLFRHPQTCPVELHTVVSQMNSKQDKKKKQKQNLLQQPFLSTCLQIGTLTPLNHIGALQNLIILKIFPLTLLFSNNESVFYNRTTKPDWDWKKKSPRTRTFHVNMEN